MKLLKQRPKIRVRLPAEVTPGERFVAEVELVAGRPVPAKAVTVTLLGEMHGGIGAANNRVHRTLQLIEQAADAEAGPRVLTGVRKYRVELQLRRADPPSFEGVDGWVRYRISVHVDIPWWPDARETFDVHVRSLPLPPAAGEPLVFSSAPDGTRGTEAQLEGSVSSSVIAPGDLLEGAVALLHVKHHRYRGVRIALVGTETVCVARRRAVREVARHQLELAVTEPAEGEALRFSFTVPPIVGGFATELVSLAWSLEVRAVVRLGSDLLLSLPVTVGSGSPARSARPRVALPSIGGERLGEIWSRVATQLGLAFEAERLTGSVGGAQVLLRRESRGKQGTFLVGELRYASLGLELELRPGGGWPFAGGRRRVELEAKELRPYRVSAREPAQAAPFVTTLVDPLARLVVEELDDRHARVVRKDGGRDLRGVSSFAIDVLTLARALAARATIPVPRALARTEASWRRLAARLQAPLCAGDLSIDGTLDGARVRVATQWDDAGAPVAARLELRPVYRMTTAQPPPAALRIAADLGAELRLAPDCLTLVLPGAPLDADLLGDRLGFLASLAARLREGTGAYR